MDSDPGAAALAALDAILAQEPAPDQALFSTCLHCLSVFRDRLAAEATHPTCLAHVNAVISIVMAGHFPLGQVPWGEMRTSRGWLERAVADHAIVAPQS